MKRALLLLLLSVCAGLSATVLWDANLPIRSSMGVESAISSCPTSDGGMLYVWSDAHAVDRDIYAMRISSTGNMVWDSPRVVDAKEGIQKNPVLTATSDGCYVVAWVDLITHREGDIRLQKINASGQALWQEGGIRATNDTVRESDIRLVPDNLGGVIVEWTRESDGSINSCGQSFSGDGTRRWQEGGIDLANIPMYTVVDIEPDGNNGIIYSYTSEYISTSRVYVNRLNSAGTAVWTDPLCIGTGDQMIRGGRFTLGGDAIFLSWTCWDGSASHSYLQKFSCSGLPLWPDPTSIYPGGDSYCVPEDIIWSPADGSVMLATIKQSTIAQLALFKISSTGQMLWPEGLIVQDFGEYFYYSGTTSMVEDGNGGLCVAWIEPSAVYQVAAVVAQRYNAQGVALWQTGGIRLSEIGSMGSMPRLAKTGSTIWAAWNAVNVDKKGIWFQRITMAGSTLPEQNGRMILEGLESMYTESLTTLARGEDMIVVWEDDRMLGQVSRLYTQAVNQDRTVDYAADGLPVTNYTGYPQYLLKAKVIPGYQTVIVWQEFRNETMEIYAQLLGSSGERLWGDNGLRLGITQGSWNSYCSIWWRDGAIFVAWTNIDYNSGFGAGTVMMQKVVGGAIQWGPQALEVTGDGDSYSNVVQALDGGYLVYSKRQNEPSGPSNLYVLAFDPANGSPLPGWGPCGKPVAEAGDYTLYYRRFMNAMVFPDGIFVLYNEVSTQPQDGIKAQRFTMDGQALLGPYGSPVLDPSTSYWTIASQCGEQDFQLLYGSFYDEQSHVLLQRFTYDLAAVWGPLLIPSYQEYDGFCGFIRFANGACSVGWVNSYYDPEYYGPAQIKYVYVTPDGALLGDEPLYTLFGDGTSIHRPEMTVAGNHALVTWLDGPSSVAWKDEPIEHARLSAIMIGNETTGISGDTPNPVAAIRLFPNFPNPFNPSTSIRFEIRNGGSAKLAVYNLKGQLVRLLVDGWMEPGTHAVPWDGRDVQGNGVASGVYLYRLEVSGKVQARKMLLMK